MINLNDEIIVDIEKMLYEGLALARVENFPVFIENACVGDKAKIRISKLKKNFANAELIEIVEPSKHRVKPFCALHNVCGGCQWQYIDYEEQLKQKQNIVKETIRKFTGKDIEVLSTIASPKQIEYRHKIQYPVSQTKVSKRILAGYYKKHTHELINIKHCPIQPKVIDSLIEGIKEKAQDLNITAYDEKKHTGILRHIVFKHSKDTQKTLVTFVINSSEVVDAVDDLASYVYKSFDNIIGVCANFNTSKNNVIFGKDTTCLIGEDYYTEKLGDITYKISANSFFQVNPYSAEKIFDVAKSMISESLEKPTILDAYSGVSSFGIWMSDIASNVVCVEEVKSASEDAVSNVHSNNVNNVEVVNGDASEIFKKLVEENAKFDAIILDPPRKGCTQEALDYTIKLAGSLIIYVSCNPSSLARDMKYLHENGFETEYIQPVDMFPHTYHIESVALIKRIAG